MSQVKIIHILKRLQVLDRDIDELRILEENLQQNRSYSNALKISLELQINNLLNERVKLMELKIENPPEHLIPAKNELAEPSVKITENRGRFSFSDLEADYLEKDMQKKSPARENSLDQEEIDNYIDQQRGGNPRPIISEFSRAKTAESRVSSHENEFKTNKPRTTDRKPLAELTRDELLKKLPQVEY